jgi:hypothetical protein
VMYVLLAPNTRRDPDHEPEEPTKEPLLIENL